MDKKRRTEKNYPIIGTIVSSENLDKIKNKDILISIDGKDLSKLNDEQTIWTNLSKWNWKNHDLLIEKEGKKLKFKLNLMNILKNGATTICFKQYKWNKYKKLHN